MRGATKMKLILAFIPVSIFAAIPYILRIRKILKMPNPDMYE